ncbi:hypothetical protein SCH4B_1234 [Ruegeria sp. TrichCH4B]|nr:hypothetical protein SCH4B_1234 [Ruegeria sp. TrichCH4B]
MDTRVYSLVGLVVGLVRSRACMVPVARAGLKGSVVQVCVNGRAAC